jgi:hypothetical protein
MKILRGKEVWNPAQRGPECVNARPDLKSGLQHYIKML